MNLNDFKYDENLDFELDTDAAGFLTLDFACGHESVSNLLRSRLDFEVDWELLADDTISRDTRAQIIRDVVISTDGVSSVDMSGFYPTTNGNQSSYGTICPVIDCDNSKTCEIAL